MTRLLTLCILCLALFFGCSTAGNEQIRDEATTQKIKPGVTTKAEVEQLLGKPTEVTFSDDGSETWKYVLTKSQMRGSAFVPIVNIFSAGVDIQTYTVTVRYKDGIVKSLGKGESKGGAGSVFD